jgi:iron complex transport system substrate-binding protein
MRRLAPFVIVLLVLGAIMPAVSVAQSKESCDFPFRETDATEEQVRVQEEPAHVVTLSPSAAQTMWEIGAREKVIGATKYAAYLDGYEAVENISGAGQTVNNELVVGLQPDLVLAPNIVQNETVQSLRRADLTVYRFHEAETVGDVKDKTRLIGHLTGECAGAEKTVGWMEERLSVVDEATAGAAEPTAMYIFFGYTAGSETFIHEIVERAGATNGAAAAGIDGFKSFNEEVIVQQNPDWLILNSDSPQVPSGPEYNRTRAVQANQVVVLNRSYVSQPAPRIVYPIETLAKAIHPEAYAEANATETPTLATQTPTATDTETPPDTGTTPGGQGPGVGVLGAVLAIAVAVGVGLRRR